MIFLMRASGSSCCLKWSGLSDRIYFIFNFLHFNFLTNLGNTMLPKLSKSLLHVTLLRLLLLLIYHSWNYFWSENRHLNSKNRLFGLTRLLGITKLAIYRLIICRKLQKCINAWQIGCWTLFNRSNCNEFGLGVCTADYFW